MDNKDITRGTGNVYADLGFPDATERQTKTRLAFIVNEILKPKIRDWILDEAPGCHFRAFFGAGTARLANWRGQGGAESSFFGG